MDHTIIHFEIPANNLEKLKTFYEKLFDWKIIHTPVENIDYWVIHTVPTDNKGMLQRPGANGGMFQKPEDQDLSQVNYITVENIDEYMEKLTKLGGKIIQNKQTVPTTGYIALALDPREIALECFSLT
jgi:predicted enzyme related to lactoylglutathione lyase